MSDPAAAQIPEQDRLRWALEQAQHRYDSTPEAQRGFPVVDSIRRVARFSLVFAAMAAAASDRRIVASLPSLEPFAVLSPAIPLVQVVVDLCRYAEEGRFDQARESGLKIVEQLIDPTQHELKALFKEIHDTAVAQGGQLDAMLGMPSALTFAEQLENTPWHRANAWLIRRTYYRILGNNARATECDERAMVIQLQDGMLPAGNVSFRADLVARWWSDDLVGLKGVMDALATSAAKFPRFEVLQHLSHYHRHRMFGEYDQAATQLLAAQALAQPCEHRDWLHVAAAEVELLTLRGEPHSAVLRAQEHIATCDRYDMQYAKLLIERAYAAALLEAGQLEQARTVLDQLLDKLRARQANGVQLLRSLDLRARVAMGIGEPHEVARWLSRCDELYAQVDSPALRFQRQRLREEAAHRGLLQLAPATNELMGGDSPLRPVMTTRDNLWSAFQNCLDGAERNHQALSILIECTSASGGYLYTVEDEEFKLVHSIGVAQPPDELAEQLGEFAASLQLDDDDTTCDLETSAGAGPEDPVRKLGLVPIPLVAASSGRRRLVALVALRQQAGGPIDIPLDVREAIARELIQQSESA